MAKKKQQECPAGAPLWVVTYGDMMTLLLTFFVLLVSMSTIQDVKFDQAASALKDAFTIIFPVPKSTQYLRHIPQSTNPNPPLAGSDKAHPSLQKVGMMLKTQISKMAVSGEIKIEYSSRGVKITIPSALLFAIGSDDLSPEGKKVLTPVSMLLQSIPNKVMVEGHTDNYPIKNDKFTTNWALSAARAFKVLEYFEEHKVDGDRLCFTGYGEHRPIAPNDTKQGRAKNRRVEIIIQHG